jgi:hypothetical protein
MQEPHSEGVANHADLESCAGDGDIAGEALGRGTGGPAIEPRNPEFRAPTLWTEGEGHIVHRASYPPSIPRQYDLRRSLFAPESSYPRPLQRPYPSGLIEQTRSGRVTGIEAPPPSHTTGHTVFRIRRLNPAALPSRRKMRWHHKPVPQQRCIR